jgi:hypothetical protein
MTHLLAYYKYYLAGLLAVSLGLNGWLLTRPTPAPITVTKTEYVDRVVEKEVEKIVYRDIVKYQDRIVKRTVTEPGGKQVVEEIKELTSEHDKSTGVDREKVVDKETKRTQSVATITTPPSYLLGIGVDHRGTFRSGSVGVRLHRELPVYLGIGVARQEHYSVTLNLGILL